MKSTERRKTTIKKINRQGKAKVRAASRKASRRKVQHSDILRQMPSYPRMFNFMIYVSLLFFILPVSAQIPSSRTMDWSKAGVQGGIPTFTTTVNFLNNGGFANITSFDNSVPLQTLVNLKAGTSTVIYFPAGTYRFKQKVTVPLAGKIIFRGAGADSTKFEFETGAINTGNFEIWGGTVGNPYDVVSGATKNSTQLVLSSASGLAVNDWVDISQENDSVLMWTTNPSNSLSSGPRSVGQVMKITSVNGNTIMLDRPLHYTYNMGLTVQLSKCDMARKIGFENFTIESVASGDKSHFVFVYAVNCWLKCVRSIKSVSTHVNPSYSANFTIRDSYFHDSYQFGSGGHGYGVALSMHTTDCLIENNVFDKLRHAMLVQRGANGNVFGYNYSINSTSDGTVSQFNRLPDGSLHGLFPYMNLYEGNVMQEIHSADTWGPSGYGNTFFRNRITREGIRISDRSLEQNIVGNDLRKDNSATFTQDVVTNESGVVSTLIHGNKESGSVSWDPSLGSNNIINSYYLTSAPSFFNGAAWPALGPEAALASGTIPAETRYANGYDTECEIPVATFVNENPSSVELNVFPNPSNGQFMVCGLPPIAIGALVEIQIFNSMGGIVFKKTVNRKQETVCLNEAPGIYFLFVKNENKTVSVNKIIITK